MSDIKEMIKEIKEDNRSGAAEIVGKAADVLMLAAQMQSAESPGFVDNFKQICVDLIDSQPSMAPIINLVNVVMIELDNSREKEPLRPIIRNAINDFTEKMERGTEKLISHAIDVINTFDLKPHILTYSYSSTVIKALIEALDRGYEFEVYCTESRPGLEGRNVLKTLRQRGVPVTYMVDMAAFSCIEKDMIDVVFVGGDSVSEDGLVNKTGTLGLAMASSNIGIPFYSLIGREKFLHADILPLHRILQHPPEEVLCDDTWGATVINEYFDTTPLKFVSRFITDTGLISAQELKNRIKKIDVSRFVKNLIKK